MLIESKFRYLTVQTRAILFLLASVAFFTGMAVCIRISATYLPILEVVFFRNLLAAIIMVPILWPKGLGVLKMNNPKLFYVRGFIGSIGMITGFTALTLIPLAQTTSISFSAPIFVTIGAMLFLAGSLVMPLTGVQEPLVIIRPASRLHWRSYDAGPGCCGNFSYPIGCCTSRDVLTDNIRVLTIYLDFLIELIRESHHA